MKLKPFISLLLAFTLSLPVFGQNLSVSYKSRTIEQVIRDLESKTNYTFVYQKQELSGVPNITMSLKNATFEDVLSSVCSTAGLTYEIALQSVVLKKGQPKVIAQGIPVKGIVTDEAGQPVVGASVLVKGTNYGVSTDIDGNYSINANSGETLVYSCIGYAETSRVARSGDLNVTLADDISLLDETVVVGYGTQKKVNLTGSVASVNVAEAMETRTVTNVSNLLSGAMAGVAAMQSSGAPGEDGSYFVIRGIGTTSSTTPLVLVDGMPANMDDVNPQDIENISVLKDAASCAIYGARAANGVILVTTKKGKSGRLIAKYSGHVSILGMASEYGLVSNTSDYMELRNEAMENIGQAPQFTDEFIQTWRAAENNPNGIAESGYPNYVAYPNTDIEKAVFNTHILNEHNLSLEGGNEKIRFLSSLGYLDNPGLVEKTGLKRYSFRTNVEADVTQWLTLGANIYASQIDKDLSDFSRILRDLYAMTPGLYPKYDGIFGGDAFTAFGYNPSFLLNEHCGDKQMSKVNATGYAQIKFLKHFTWNTNINFVRNFSEEKTWDNPNRKSVSFTSGETMYNPKSLDAMLLDTFNSSDAMYTLENFLKYNQSLGNHNVSALAGYQEYAYTYSYLSTSKKGFIDYNCTSPSAVNEMQSIDGNTEEYSARSWFGRINYDYKGKYLFEANIRYDGSSRFHKDHRWGVFPSFSAGWRISEENFMKNSNIDNLKLRASWGKLGNNDIGNYVYQATYGKSVYSFSGKNVDGLAATAFANSALKWETTIVTNLGVDLGFFNNRLTVEIDAYDKITDGILCKPDVYMTAGTKDAPMTNLATVDNKGVELNIGWRNVHNDFSYSVNGNIAYNLNRVKKYKGEYKDGWTNDENGSKVWNSNIGDVSTGDTQRIVEGKKIYEYYLLQPHKGNGNYFNADGSPDVNGGPKDGMIRTTQDMEWVNAMVDAGYTFQPNSLVSKQGLWYGDYIYADLNGDGIYGSNYDYAFQGCSDMAPVFYGLQFNFAYKNFDLSGNFSGTMFKKIYWGPSCGLNSTIFASGWAMAQRIADDHYFFDPENPSDSRTNIDAKYGRLVGTNVGHQSNAESTLCLYKADYLKLKNIAIGYHIPDNVARKICTQGIRVYLNMENVFTLTKYPGFDPEMGAGYNYLLPRTISLGANITF